MVSKLEFGGGGKVKQKRAPGSGSSALKDLDTQGGDSRLISRL